MFDFKKSYVVNTEQGKNLNIPKMDGNEAMIFRGMNEERVEMYRAVENEMNRALAAELQEFKRATREEQWIMCLIENYHQWEVALSKTIVIPSTKYLYSVKIKATDDLGREDHCNSILPPRELSPEGKQFGIAILFGRMYVVSNEHYNEDYKVSIYQPKAEYVNLDIEIVSTITKETPWDMTMRLFRSLDARVARLEGNS